MTLERWAEIKRLFDAAVALGPAERSAFIAASCANDEDLCRELESLLAADKYSADSSDTRQSPRLAEGSRLGHYEVVSFLGAGGVGEVYKARDVRLDRLVAIKVLNVLATGTSELRARFEREARAVAALSHPHICKLYDVGSEGNANYLVMEYLEGETLAQRLGREPLSRDELFRYAIQVAEALQSAHECGVVHRDLKPANVMLTNRGATLLDFGLAKLSLLTADDAEDVKSLTAVGSVLGTLYYMAPEQLAGHETDERTDVFAFGALLYEMATGRKAFLSGDALASPALDRVVTRCLARDPAHRWQSCQALLRELRAAETRAARPSQRFTLAGKRAMTATAILVMLTIAAVLAMSRAPTGSGLDAIAVLPFENGSTDQNLEYLADGITEGLINQLSRLQGVRVPPRTLVAGYTMSRDDLQKIGRELGVDAVVTGRLVKRGDTLTVAAELVDVNELSQLWGGQFPTLPRSAGSVETTIAAEIAGRLQRSPGQSEIVAERSMPDPEAYEAYMRGRYYVKQRTRDGFAKAVAQLEQAIEIDPSYVLAHAGLADALTTAVYYNMLPAAEAYPKAKLEAERALQLDDQTAEAHAALAVVKLLYEWNFADAERHYQRAIELQPNFAIAHTGYSIYLASQGRLTDAIVAALRAEELDPVSPNTAAHVGWIYYFNRQYDHAIEKGQKALALSREHAGAYELLAEVVLAEGLDASDLRFLIGDNATSVTAREQLAYIEAVRGDAAARNRFLASLRRASSEPSQIPLVKLATMYAAFGDRSHAFELLERAVVERAGQLVWLNVSPNLDPLRTDPRFGDLVRRVGLAR
jgi:TolB-like protein/tetratricopeptide (TPR) repeat protein